MRYNSFLVLETPLDKVLALQAREPLLVQCLLR